jgi:hypothetical protein
MMQLGIISLLKYVVDHITEDHFVILLIMYVVVNVLYLFTKIFEEKLFEADDNVLETGM